MLTTDEKSADTGCEADTHGQPASPPVASNAVTLLSWAKRRPWLASVLAIFFLAAVATMVGLPVASAWLYLATGLLVLAFVALVIRGFGWYRWTAQTETGAEQRRKIWEGIGRFVAIGVIYWIARYHVGKENRPYPSTGSGISPAQRRNIQSFMENSGRRATRTAEYWKTTVAALHLCRFSLPPTHGDEIAQDYFQRRYEVFSQLLKLAQNASPQDVDADLLSLTQQLLALDVRELQLVDQYLQLAQTLNITLGQETVEENSRRAEDFRQALASMSDDEFGKLPPAIQQIVTDMATLEDDRFEQLRKIEIMQARLSERYKGSTFHLPELAENIN